MTGAAASVTPPGWSGQHQCCVAGCFYSVRVLLYSEGVPVQIGCSYTVRVLLYNEGYTVRVLLYSWGVPIQ